MSRYKDYYQSLQTAYNDNFALARISIEKDIRRTYASQISKEDREVLFRILFSYAKRNSEIGYCQGMNIIAYFFLTSGFSEEQSFWMLAYLIENIIPKGYYTNMIAVITDISLLKHLFSVLLSGLVSHFLKNMLDINHFLVPWFLMTFTNLENTEVC